MAQRAAWIVRDETASPVNAADKPVKDKDTDVILSIISEDNPAEQAAIATYWKAAWLADGDQAKTKAAFDALARSPGMDPERAARLIETYVPFNFLERPAPPLKKRSRPVGGFCRVPKNRRTRRQANLLDSGAQGKRIARPLRIDTRRWRGGEEYVGRATPPTHRGHRPLSRRS